jgi:tetratricopeptide (TPR) repeat protein
MLRLLPQNWVFHRRNQLRCCVWAALLCFAAACALPPTPAPATVAPGATPTPTASQTPAAHRDAELVGVLTGFTGEVTAVVDGGRVSVVLFQPLLAGTTIDMGEGASATIHCLADRLLVFTGPSQVTIDAARCEDGEPLPGSSTRLVPGGGRLRVNHNSLELEGEAREAEGDYGNIPIIVNPRNTNLLESMPTVQWIEVPGAIEYVLELSGPTSFAPVTLKAESLACFADERTTPYRLCASEWGTEWQLAAGRRYFLTVSARLGIASPLRRSQRSSLRILDTATATQLQGEISAIKARQLDPVTVDLLLAGLYAEHEVYAQAIPHFERVLAVQPAPVLAVTVGDAYRAIDLQRFAALAYRQALDGLDPGKDDPAVRAAAEFGLGMVEYRRMQFALAEPHFVKAVELYHQVAAQEELAAAQTALAKTQKRQ